MPTNAGNRIAFIARVSLICPFLVVLLALVGNRLDAPYRGVAEVGVLVLGVAGLLSGIVALVRGRESAGASVAVQGGIGFLISLVFVGIVLNNYLQSRSSPPDQAGSVSPEAQQLSEALAKFVARTTELEQRLVAASKPLAQSPVLDLAGVESAADLASRQSQVRAFMEISQALSNHLARTSVNIETQLTAHGVAPAKAREISAGFLGSLQPKLSLLSQIRQVEHEYSQTLTNALNLLAAQWGKWTPTADGTPRFDDETHAQLYTGFLDRLKTLEARDLELKDALAGAAEPSISP